MVTLLESYLGRRQQSHELLSLNQDTLMFRTTLLLVAVVVLASSLAADEPIDQEATDETTTTLVYIQYDGARSVFSGNGELRGISERMSLKDIVDRLSQMPNLRRLRVDTSYREHLGIEEYRQLARLVCAEDIHIETYATIKGPELAPLARLMRLSTLEFEEAGVKLSVLKTLVKFPSLKTFRIPFAGDAWDRELKPLGATFHVYHTGNYAP